MTIRIDPKKLRAARKAAGLTQAALAEAVGMGWIQLTVSMLERGRETEITADNLTALAQVLQVSPQQLEAKGSMPTAGLSLDGARLKAARKAAGLTQQELAARAGLIQSSLSNLETGTTGVSLDKVQTLAQILQVSVKYLVGGADEPLEEKLDSAAAIRAHTHLPAGLRELAASTALLDELQIMPDEWQALAALAVAWRDAEVTPRDGWVQLLVSLRTAPIRLAQRS